MAKELHTQTPALVSLSGHLPVGVVFLLGLSMLCLVLTNDRPDNFLFRAPDSTPLRRNNSQMLRPPSRPASCSCFPSSVILKHFVPKDQFRDVTQRRNKEYQSYKVRKSSTESTQLYAASNSPLQYPIQGFIVRPMTPTLIPDLRLFAEKRSIYKVNLKTSKGKLTIDSSTKRSSFIANVNQTELTIISNSLVTVNFLLASVLYSSSSYHINTGDFVWFQFEEHESAFPVSIKQPHVPVLWDVGTEIKSHVTITTKTTPPFSSTKALVESIKMFYPSIKIFIADDINKRRSFSGPNIEQYFMPPKKGLFAGRNLVVSQLTTKYFLWVDDNFLFTENTKIEKFVEVMEANPELDVVGGSLQGKPLHLSMFYEEGDDEEGGCLHMKFGVNFHPLPTYPHCSLVSGVVNFFLARTDAIRRVGFDPNIRKTGHPELFIDGLGSLMVVSCDDPSNMSINLQPQDEQDYFDKKYKKPQYDEEDYRYQIYFFKNHLKCFSAV